MLSVIIPYVNEYPQNVFTIAAVHEELSNVEHEIIAVNNKGTDKGYDKISAASVGKPVNSANFLYQSALPIITAH